jgi:transposase InsO family protein
MEVAAVRGYSVYQTWRAFLANHIDQIVAADFFVVPTATYRLLFVLVILAHERRRIVHVAVTDPPPRGRCNGCAMPFPGMRHRAILIHNRDHAFDGTVAAMEIHQVLTAPRSPWQNAYVERFIGSVRRECLDHVIVAPLRRSPPFLRYGDAWSAVA